MAPKLFKEKTRRRYDACRLKQTDVQEVDQPLASTVMRATVDCPTTQDRPETVSSTTGRAQSAAEATQIAIEELASVCAQTICKNCVYADAGIQSQVAVEVHRQDVADAKTATIEALSELGVTP